MAKSPQNTPLLTLPRELRDSIYDLTYDGAFVGFKGYDGWKAPARSTFQRAQTHFGDGGAVVFSRSGRIYHPRQPLFDTARILAAPFHDRKVPAKDTELCQLEHKTEFCLANNEPSFAHQVRLNSALLWTCKQISSEFAAVLYSKTMFGFGTQSALQIFLKHGGREDSMKHLMHLQKKMTACPEDFQGQHKRPALPRAPPAAQHVSLIKHLSLVVESYGVPSSTTDQIWFDRYYRGWSSTSKRLVSRLTALTSLHLVIYAPLGGNMMYRLDQAWTAWLAQFAGGCPVLDVHIDLRVSMADTRLIMCREALEAFAECLRRKAIGWDDDSAKEAILAGSQEHRGRNATGVDMDEDWRRLCAMNGLTWPEYSAEEEEQLADLER